MNYEIRPTLPHRGTQAFTLIELLTVIAVIAILAGILIPVTSQVRKKAAASKTSSNLRQIGVAVQLYANENKGMFPNENGKLTLSSQTIPGLGGVTNWREAIHRYVTTDYIPRSGYNYAIGADNEVWKSGNAEPVSNHFGVNVFMAYHRHFRLNLIPDPAKYVIMGEINSGAHVIDPRTEPDYTGTVVSRNRISHPGNTAFYLYADGHIEQLEGPQLPADNPKMWEL